MWSACHHYAPLGGVLFSTEQRKDVRLLCISLEEELGLCFITDLFFKLSYFSCLTAFPLFLHPLTSLISYCLSFLFGPQGSPRRIKPFFLPRRNGEHRKSHKVLPSFSYLLNFFSMPYAFFLEVRHWILGAEINSPHPVFSILHSPQGALQGVLI